MKRISREYAAASVNPGLVDRSVRDIGESFSVGPLAFGCWRFTGSSIATAGALIETALDCGMNLIDTADVYGLDWGGTGFGACEELLGKVLASQPSLRHRMVLATKGGIWPGTPYDSSRAYIRSACEASLRRLRCEVIDLYQIHRPDPFTHPGELGEVLGQLIEEGKIREIGVSNHTPAQVMSLQAHLGVEIASVQPELSAMQLTALRDGVADQCNELGLTMLAWSPLAGGRLITGDGVRPELLAVLDEIAEREGVDRAAVAVAFVLALPSRPVAIVGTQQPQRLRDLAGALQVHLERPDVYRIIEASDGVRLP
jgi:aryl-alcohol dehydrogenase-like predicted oxidoreductase